jgi:hypothetical protein
MMTAAPQASDSDPLKVERCLLLISSDWQSGTRDNDDGTIIRTVRSVSVDSVLAQAWNPSRLERCRRLLQEGSKAPAISVVGLRLKRPNGKTTTLYAVSDGMHRTTAAREAGRRTIRAVISGWYVCDPTRYLIWRDWLWDASDPQSYKSVTNDFDADTAAELIALGVRLISNSGNPAKGLFPIS